MKFYQCEHCGNLAVKLTDSGVPLVCCGQEVFWIAGMRIGESARVTPESRRLLLVELIRDTAGISGT